MVAVELTMDSFFEKGTDPNTNLFYFNQRYYDPELGRFLTEDPAKQALNPYLYCGNNPLMYVDPDGEFFQFAIPFIVAAFQGAAISAVANTAMQYVMTGTVNFDAVGQSAIGGALGGILNFGIGEMFKHGITNMGQFAIKTMAHGAAGGIQSMAMGGDFKSGFLAGGIGHMTGALGDSVGGDVGGVIGASLGGGLSSSMVGGDFYKGAQTGAMGYLFNTTGTGIVGAGVSLFGDGLRSLGVLAQKVPDPVYDLASVTLGVADIVAYSTGVGAVPLAVANVAVNSGSLYKTYKKDGISSKFGVQLIAAAAGPAGGFISKEAGGIVGGIAGRAGLILSNIRK